MDENQFITRKEDLVEILSKRPKCLESTANGKFIISHEQLPNILLTTFKKKPVFNFIVHSKSQDGTAGHWWNLTIFNNKTLFFLDGLNHVKYQSNVMSNIKKFIKINNLTMHNFNIRYQAPSSKKCGFLACFFVYKSVSSSVMKFFKLLLMLKQNSMKTNEEYMFKLVKKYFNLHI